MTTLDNYCQQNDIQRIDLIKMDVEGAELLVLKGAEKVLTEMKPVIVMEVSHRTTARFGYSVSDLIEFLERHGYQVHRIEDEENAIVTPLGK